MTLVRTVVSGVALVLGVGLFVWTAAGFQGEHVFASGGLSVAAGWPGPNQLGMAIGAMLLMGGFLLRRR